MKLSTDHWEVPSFKLDPAGEAWQSFIARVMNVHHEQGKEAFNYLLIEILKCPDWDSTQKEHYIIAEQIELNQQIARAASAKAESIRAQAEYMELVEKQAERRRARMAKVVARLRHLSHHLDSDQYELLLDDHQAQLNYYNALSQAGVMQPLIDQVTAAFMRCAKQAGWSQEALMQERQEPLSPSWAERRWSQLDPLFEAIMQLNRVPSECAGVGKEPPSDVWYNEEDDLFNLQYLIQTILEHQELKGILLGGSGPLTCRLLVEEEKIQTHIAWAAIADVLFPLIRIPLQKLIYPPPSQPIAERGGCGGVKILPMPAPLKPACSALPSASSEDKAQEPEERHPDPPCNTVSLTLAAAQQQVSIAASPSPSLQDELPARPGSPALSDTSSGGSLSDLPSDVSSEVGAETPGSSCSEDTVLPPSAPHTPREAQKREALHPEPPPTCNTVSLTLAAQQQVSIKDCSPHRLSALVTASAHPRLFSDVSKATPADPQPTSNGGCNPKPMSLKQ